MACGMSEFEWECPYCIDGGNDLSMQECAVCGRTPPGDPALYKQLIAARERRVREELLQISEKIVRGEP
jgi:hypothetical protein